MLTSIIISAMTCLALSWLDVVPHKAAPAPTVATAPK